MKTKDKIFCADLPAVLVAALAEALAPPAEPTRDSRQADILITASAAPLPAGLSPAVPRLNIDTSRPQRLGDLVRRARQMIDAPAFYIDDLSIGTGHFRPQEKTMTAEDGTSITLTDKEVDILVCLARRGGDVLRRDDLLRYVWRYQPGIDTHTLETHVYRLRQKLATLKGLEQLLQTDDDGGYRLSLEIAPASPDADDAGAAAD